MIRVRDLLSTLLHILGGAKINGFGAASKWPLKMAGVRGECTLHGTDVSGSGAELYGVFRMDDDGISIRPISFVRPILEEGNMQTRCAMIKLQVGFSLDSTIDQLVVLCSSFIEWGYNKTTLPTGSLGRFKEYIHSGQLLVVVGPQKIAAVMT